MEDVGQHRRESQLQLCICVEVSHVGSFEDDSIRCLWMCRRGVNSYLVLAGKECCD